MPVAATLAVAGHVSPGFEAVRDAFEENFTERGELGGACSAFLGADNIVDLWGGVRDRGTGEPWREDTMVIVYSTTKGLAAMALAVAHSRGWLDYERAVAEYWPEFAQQGKERITVRQLLAHQAGLYALDEPITRELVTDLDRLAAVLARQRPAWRPGTRQGYHAITLGFYEGELLRRLDPRHRTIGRFFQDEIATPLGLGLDLYLRLPETVPDDRLARMSRAGRTALLRGFPFRLALDTLNPHSRIRRALQGSEIPEQGSRVYARDVEIPSGGAVCTARAIARAYGAFATGGAELGLRQETLDLLAAPAVPPARGFHDLCMRADVHFSLGFMKPSASFPFGSAMAFGFPGAGGSFGFAEPVAALGYGYVTCQMGVTLTGDPRDTALREAIYRALPSRPR